MLMAKDKVVGLILSGSGSDATAILNAWLDDKMPCGIRIGVIIVTNKNAGFFERRKDFPGEEFPAPVILIDQGDYRKGKVHNPHGRDFTMIYSRVISDFLDEYDVDIAFYVGNIVKINPTRLTYNIHPVKKKEHGGRHMHGLNTHKHALDEICDKIWREEIEMNDEHYTTVTVHEVDEAYDSGHSLISLDVQVPPEIIEAYHDLFVRLKKAHDYLEKNGGTVDKAIEISVILKGMTEVAHKLQQHVLPFEWSLLPKAVEIAAMKLNSI